MTGDPRLVRALLACYPADWRERFGAEYSQLLCDLRVHRHPMLVLDSLRGAAHAQLAPGGPAMSVHRSPMTLAVWAAAVFTVAGLAFQKLAEDVAVATGVRALLVAVATVALLALVVAALPTAVALVRGRDRRAWWYVAVPVVGVAVWLGVVRVAVDLADGHPVRSAQSLLALALVGLVGIGVVAATAWAASTVLRRVPAQQPERLRPAALTVVAVGMGAAAISALVWGFVVHADAPGSLATDGGLAATPFAPSWVATVALMGAATALAGVAVRRQRATTR
jgi:hypothetical protein